MARAAVSPARGGCVLACRLTPSSARNEVAGITEESVRIKVTSPPVEGKANKALINFLGKIFKVPKSRIAIVKGETGRQKKVFIEGLETEAVMKKIMEAL